MTRVQWFSAKMPFGIRAFAGRLSELPLDIDGPSGFRIERVRNDALEATYFERFTWSEHTYDPFGGESALERTAYRSLRFTYSKRYPELEIVDAPRGLKSFFSRIADITDFETSISPLTVDVAAWAAAFQEASGPSFRIGSMTVTNLSVEEGVTGQLTVASRERDVEAALSHLLQRRSYVLQKVQMVPLSISPRPLVISSNGIVRSEKAIDLSLLELLRDTLPEQR